jgi:hypothetical protein
MTEHLWVILCLPAQESILQHIATEMSWILLAGDGRGPEGLQRA